jgi:hypothetical protein
MTMVKKNDVLNKECRNDFDELLVEKTPIIGGGRALVENIDDSQYSAKNLMPLDSIIRKKNINWPVYKTARSYFNYFCHWNHNLLNNCSIKVKVFSGGQDFDLRCSDGTISDNIETSVI